LATETGNTTTRGTVFNDSAFDRLTVGGNLTSWVLFANVPSSDPLYRFNDLVTDLSKARKKTSANRINP
ncbi:MAG: hypothetical protein RJA81_1381, partial [Planctomycetota bacterium]